MMETLQSGVSTVHEQQKGAYDMSVLSVMASKYGYKRRSKGHRVLFFFFFLSYHNLKKRSVFSASRVVSSKLFLLLAVKQTTI
jgi:hypothetical protein